MVRVLDHDRPDGAPSPALDLVLNEEDEDEEQQQEQQAGMVSGPFGQATEA